MIKHLLILITLFSIAACSSNSGGYDRTAFKNSKPKSILVLPPVNKTMDVNAVNGVYAQVTYPLSESGYYVLPVTLVNETLKQNGITVSDEASQISITKLHEIFGADAVLYLTISQYGTTYQVINSDTRVTVTGTLVDARTGQQLWSAYATASSTEGSSNQGGIVGMLVSAAMNQIIASVTEREYSYAGITDIRLLSAGGANQILYGPRSPRYEP